MTRETLTNTIMMVLEGLHYTPYCGFTDRANELVHTMPAALIEPLTLLSANGRTDGAHLYHVSIKLMQTMRGSVSAQKQKIWSDMQGDAMVICNRMAGQPLVRRLSEVKCTPAEFSITGRGELSMALNFNIEILFFNGLEAV